MLISKEMTYSFGGNTLARRDYGKVSDPGVENSPGSSIPPRYRDGMGGINLDTVKQDQRQARREFVRAMIRNLVKSRRY